MDECIAYLITFTCYGSHLHGSRDNTVDNRHNVRGSEFFPENASIATYEANLMQEPPWLMDNVARAIVQSGLQELCHSKKWKLIGIAVRMNHVHIVVWAPTTPEQVAVSCKAKATLELRKRGVAGGRKKFWTRHASTRRLFKIEEVERVLEYILEQQGSWLGTEFFFEANYGS